MKHDEINIINQSFTKFLTGHNFNLGELFQASNSVVANPRRDNLLTIHSDWQGHAAISMKRAVFTLTMITLLQYFVLGDAFQLQSTWLPHELPNGGYIRLKIAFTVSALLSLVLYVLAFKRDKQIRDLKVSMLKLALEEFGEKYQHFKDLYQRFKEESGYQIKDSDWQAVLFGISRHSKREQNFHEASSSYTEYDKGVRPNSFKQDCLDIYDMKVIPTLALLSIGIVWLT
jgi:hypothetical protein